MSLREKQMAARRGRILDATASLIRETHGTGFTMRDVAHKAELSPATPYNLFGSKDGLMYALLNRSLDALMHGTLSFRSPNPLEHPLEAAEVAAGFFASDPDFYRELFIVFLGVRDDLHRPWFMQRCLEFWRHALEAAGREGLLPRTETARDDLARSLLVHFTGVLDLWAHGDLDDDGFRGQIIYGTVLHLLAFAEAGPVRKRLQRRLAATRVLLPARGAFLRGSVAAPPLVGTSD